jgi:5'-3' exonuclease
VPCNLWKTVLRCSIETLESPRHANSHGPDPAFFLIDGHALAYRTYYALTRRDASRWTTNGEPTAGTHGFASVLLRLLEKDAPEYLAVSFDTGRTFRDEAYPAYKATRAKMPRPRAPARSGSASSWPPSASPFWSGRLRADDVLGTVARQAADQEVAVTILTGDRDLLQLASDRITIRLAGRNCPRPSTSGRLMSRANSASSRSRWSTTKRSSATRATISPA